MRKRLTERQAKQAAAGLRREISEDFKYDKKKIKHLQKILHNVNISLGTLGSALHEFSRIKGPTISPDGLLGGLGYIMPIKTVKEVITTSVHNLSEVADSLADELTNPHWHSEDDKETKELIKEKEQVEEETQKVLDTPEGEPSEGEPEPKEEPAEEGIQPDDIVNSTERVEEEARMASKKTDRVLSAKVRQALVRFSSVGKQKI
jgi:hypothetical protein